MQNDASSQGSSNETREWPSPEAVAAAVNAIVVVCLPVILIITMWLTPTTSVTVHADSASATAFVKLAETLFVFVPFTAFAAVAAWRTWTHARRYLDGNGAGWQGVAEAGALGFFPALLILRGGIVTRPADAAPYVIAYAGGALLSGLVMGLILRWTALLTLKSVLRARHSHQI